MKVLKSGYVQKKGKCAAKKEQPWFTEARNRVYKEFHRAMSEWLRSADQVKRTHDKSSGES